MKTKQTYPEFVAQIIRRGNGNPKGLDAIKRAIERTPCKLTYSQLKVMLDRANYHHDEYWNLELYDVAIRYTKIAQRILQAMCKPENKLNYLK